MGRRGLLSEAVADGVEFVVDFVRQAPQGRDGGNRNESGDEGILDQVLTGVVGEQGHSAAKYGLGVHSDDKNGRKIAS